MDIFKKIDSIEENELHIKYRLLRDEMMYFGERKILENWANDFIDKDNKFIHQFQTTFHSSFWELYLHSVLKEYNFTINYFKNRPDFIIETPYKFYLEAVTANIKNGGLPESKRTIDDVFTMLENHHEKEKFYFECDEAIVRYSNSIMSKNKLYLDNYSKCNWVHNDIPFLVALASYDQINYGHEFIYPMMALLYGYYWNVEEQKYNKREKIKKPNTDADIYLGIFNNKEFENISAIIFSCTTTLGKLTALSVSNDDPIANRSYVFNIKHDIEDVEIPYKMQIVSKDVPEYLDDGLFIFHNPNSKNKFPVETFQNTNIIQVCVKNDEIRFEGGNLPIISRFCISKSLIPDVKSFVTETMLKYNGLIK